MTLARDSSSWFARDEGFPGTQDLRHDTLESSGRTKMRGLSELKSGKAEQLPPSSVAGQEQRWFRTWVS